LYSIGFINVLNLPNGSFKERVIGAFFKWAATVEAFDIVGKYEKDQRKNKRFEILVHNTLLPISLLRKTNVSLLNQNYFNEGFKKEITREVALRDRKVIELAKDKYGTKCTVCSCLKNNQR